MEGDYSEPDGLELLFNPFPAVDYFIDAQETRKQALYPAQLADEMLDDFVFYAGTDDVVEARNYLGPLKFCCANRTWGLLFKSLRPACPVDFTVFEAFVDAIANEDAETYIRMRDGAVRFQIQLFSLWVEAAELWDERPPDEDRRASLMRRIVAQNPKLKMKGEPDSIMKRFRLACKEKGLAGIKESEGLKMIREMKGVLKRRRRTD